MLQWQNHQEAKRIQWCLCIKQELASGCGLASPHSPIPAQSSALRFLWEDFSPQKHTARAGSELFSLLWFQNTTFTQCSTPYGPLFLFPPPTLAIHKKFTQIPVGETGLWCPEASFFRADLPLDEAALLLPHAIFQSHLLPDSLATFPSYLLPFIFIPQAAPQMLWIRKSVQFPDSLLATNKPHIEIKINKTLSWWNTIDIVSVTCPKSNSMKWKKEGRREIFLWSISYNFLELFIQLRPSTWLRETVWRC